MQSKEKVEEVCVPYTEENISSIIQAVKQTEATEEESLITTKSFDSLAYDKLSTEVEKNKEEIEGLKADRVQRVRLSWAIFGLVAVYLVAVLVLLFFNGFSLTKLTDAVLMTLLGTTTANVLGILIIVATYYFHKNKKQ